MRLISNKESVVKGEVSVLAIVETFLAIALVFYLSAHFNTLRWLAIAMCVSPLLLLRTKKSTRLGIRWWNLWYFGVLKNPRVFFPTSMKIIGVILGAIVVRMIATITSVITAPPESFRAIPRNWARIAFAMDMHQSPELIPGNSHLTMYSDTGYRLRQFQEARSLDRLPHILVIPFECFLLYTPALFYRWSLKATSIIYAPLIFIAHSTFKETVNLRMKLELIKHSDLSRIRALYGIVAIIGFFVKLVLMMKWSGFVEWWNGNPITEFISLYIAPAEIPKWQFAEVVNSVLAVGAMFFARHALLHYELDNPWPEKSVKHLLGFVSGVRWVLALYAIVCLGYITMRAAHNWHWPALGTKWLPFL